MPKIAETVTKGSADEKLDAAGRPDGEVRMHDRDTVGLALLALEEGMTLAGAAEVAGVPLRTVANWPPAACRGATPAGGRAPV